MMREELQFSQQDMLQLSFKKESVVLKAMTQRYSTTVNNSAATAIQAHYRAYRVRRTVIP